MGTHRGTRNQGPGLAVRGHGSSCSPSLGGGSWQGAGARAEGGFQLHGSLHGAQIVHPEMGTAVTRGRQSLRGLGDFSAGTRPGCSLSSGVFILWLSSALDVPKEQRACASGCPNRLGLVPIQVGVLMASPIRLLRTSLFGRESGFPEMQVRCSAERSRPSP